MFMRRLKSDSMYGTIILSVALHVRANCSVTLREETRVRVLKGIFGPITEKVAGLEAGERCMRSFITCKLHEILLVT
jgi:hypothetical protein